MPDTFVPAHPPRAAVDAIPEAAGLVAVSGGERLRAPAPVFSLWLQLRGSAQVSAVEGSFSLQRGAWIALERGSAPEVSAGPHGLTLGLWITAEAMQAVLGVADRGLLPGRGALDRSDRRIALRLWRRCAASARSDGTAALPGELGRLLRHWQGMQDPFAALIERCPGRSYHRKTRIFARIQRARLYLEGNPQRMLRIEDLMELTRFSSWWLSKTFHAVYQETLQKASMRLRMQRARELLSCSELSITELAEACGFHDPCSFARQFKATHGETASAWRARHDRQDGQGRVAPPGRACGQPFR